VKLLTGKRLKNIISFALHDLRHSLESLSRRDVVIC
jgi:hypothetical protein